MRSRELLLGVSSQAGHAGQRLLLASGQLVQNKVKVGRGGHGVEHVGLVRDEQVWEEGGGGGLGVRMDIISVATLQRQRTVDSSASHLVPGR